jgi:hypothetical protein
MKYANPTSKASVSTIDGYTFLPFLSEKVTFKPGAETNPSVLPTILHEYTHQLQLRSPFGLTLAYLNAASSCALDLSRKKTLQEITDAPSLFHPEYLASHYYHKTFGQYHLNYDRLATFYRWIAEGLATFAEIDYLPSSKYECSFPIFSLVLNFLQKGASTIGFANNSMHAAKSCFHESTKGSRESGTLSSILTSSNDQATCYFVGYISLKEIKFILSRKDPRLTDNEMFLLFINAYFFNDLRILEFADFCGNQNFEHRIRSHLLGTIRDIVNVSSVRLREVVDQLENFSRYPGDYLYRDYSALLRGDSSNYFDESSVVPQLRNKLVVQMIMTTAKTLKFKDDDNTLKESQAIIGKAVDTFDILRLNHSIFKVANREAILVSIREMEYGADFLTITESGTIFGFDKMDSNQYRALMDIAKRDSNDFIPFEDATKSFFLTKDLIAKLGSLRNPFRFRQADCVFGDNRVLLHFKENWSVVKVIQSSDTDARSIEDKLGAIAPYLDRKTYWNRLTIPVPPDLPSEYTTPFQDIGTGMIDFYPEIWKILFVGYEASEKELINFFNQKCQLIARGRAELDFLNKALRDTSVYVSVEELSIAEKLNLRWKRYTGRNLFSLTNSNEVRLTF